MPKLSKPLSKSTKKPKSKTVCIVTYVAPDNYGKVSKSIEAVLDSSKNFSKWLKQHNKERKADGSLTEKACEFSLKTLTIETFK